MHAVHNHSYHVQDLPPHTCVPLTVAWIERLAAGDAEIDLTSEAAQSLLQRLTASAATVRSPGLQARR